MELGGVVEMLVIVAHTVAFGVAISLPHAVFAATL